MTPPLVERTGVKSTTAADAARSLPAPFLTKTYQLVDDKAIDDIISWNEDGSTFIVWNPTEFAKDLLPKDTPCSKMSSNASNQSFSSYQRASKLRILVGCMETTYKPYNVLRTKSIDRGPPPPENDIFFTTYHTRSRTSGNGLLATICVLATFIAALGFSSSTFKEAYSTSKDLITSRLLIAMNTLVFIVSLVMDMFLVQKYTYKWELQIVLFSLFGAYLCLMKVMIPQATVSLLLLSVPFLFFAAA